MLRLFAALRVSVEGVSCAQCFFVLRLRLSKMKIEFYAAKKKVGRTLFLASFDWVDFY